MSEMIQKEHALAAFMQRHRVTDQVNSTATIEILAYRSHINLRGDPSNREFVAAVTAVFGQSLPEPGCVIRGAHAIYWLGPREFLVVSETDASAQLVTQLQTAFAGIHAAATDLSGGQLLLRISGEHARSILCKGSTLDLYPDIFGKNRCAQSTLAKAAALYARTEDDNSFELVVRRSFVDYIAQWLAHAGSEFSVTFSQ